MSVYLFASRRNVVIVVFFLTGALQQKARPHWTQLQLNEELQPNEEDDDGDLGGEMHNELVRAVIGKTRYKCHSCEPPACNNPTVCYNAVFCWKSRVRETTGE